MTVLASNAIKKGGMVKTFGWVMNWKPYYAVGNKKLGEELTIKTMFTRDVDGERVSVYLGNVIVDVKFFEEMRKIEEPVAVFVTGVKRAEHAYPNAVVNCIEPASKVVYVYLKKKDLSVKIVPSVPVDVMKKTGMVPPRQTFKQFMAKENEKRARAGRKARDAGVLSR